MNGRRLLALLSLVSGCTFGGSSEDPSKMVIPTLDAAVDSRVAPDEPEPDEPEPNEPLPVVDSGAAPDAVVSEPTLDGGSSDDASALCQAEEPAATCDPLKNTGCPALTQCEVEGTATVRTGRCVFPQAPTTAECSVLPLATVCAPQFTCVGTSCRKLCDCDTDCPDNECCRSDISSPPILFKLCQPC